MQSPRTPIDAAPSRKFDLALLGRFELTGPDGLIELPGRKLAGLLAYLACTAPRPQSRETLSTLLWGSHFDAQAKQNLRQALSRLRRLLGQNALESDSEVVGLNATAVQSDVSRFEALIREGSRDALSAAADLYRGRLIDDVAVSEEGWSDWLARERERLLDLALGALMGLGQQELAAGRGEQALKAGRRAITLNDMREDAHRLVIQALAATERKAEALKHYQDLAALLKRELNTEPDAATRALAAELRRTQPPVGSHAVEIARPALPQPGRPSMADHPNGAGEPAASEAAARTGGAERRQLTILVCSMVGSIGLAARLDPEDMRASIATFHKGVADVVAPFDGFVAQYVGNDVLVYFGYPAAREHHTEQAVRAGLAIVDAVRGLEDTSGATLQARVSIATGLVVVGEPLGSDGAGQLVAIGEAPDLAARLQAAASPGEVVIAASTHRLVGRMFDCRALGSSEMKGLAHPVEAWQVRGEAAGVSRFEARRAGALLPLIGRQEEIDRLLQRWDQARHGEGQVVLLSGEPGIGKSRIAESLLAEIDNEPLARRRYSCAPHHTHSPLFPFIAQLEEAAGFEPGSGAGAKLDRLESLLVPTVKNPTRDVALIADILGVPTGGRYPALSVSPQQKREMTFTALLDQLAGAAAQGPVLIVFEDTHWIDPTSQDLLDRMVARVAGLPVLLLVTARSELRPTWVDEPHATMLPLSRLGRRDSAGIIKKITKDKPLPDTVVERVLSRADGVPLFLEELTTTLLESGLLRETMDRYVLDGPLPLLAIPMTLQASLVARLDRLGSVKDVAQIGATIGREFAHELIAAVSASTSADLGAALDRLTESGLVSRRGVPPDATYSFKHALVQDAAYATMLRSRRRQLHASIAKVLIERFAAIAESQPEVIAQHFTEAGLAIEAIGFWRKAGHLANARSAGREATTSFERALSLVETLPESPASLEQGFEIRLEVRSSLLLLGEGRKMLELLREAEVLAERLNDDRRRGQICQVLTTSYALVGELDEALAMGTRALEIAKRLGDVKLGIVATNSLEQVHNFRGEYGRAVELATDNLAALPEAEWGSEYYRDAAPPPVHDRFWLLLSLGQLGRFAEASRYEAEAIRIAESTPHSYSAALLYSALGSYNCTKGSWSTARSLLERAVAVARTGNVPIVLSIAVITSTWVLAELGEASAALGLLREGEQLLEYQVARGLGGRAGTCFTLGRACLLLGRLDEARRLCERAIEFSQQQRGYAAQAHRLLGEVASHPDRLDAERSEAHYRQSLALAESCGMRPLVAHCHLGRGKLYRRLERREEARADLATATAMYRDMGMTHYLERAEAEMLQSR